jgi:FAD/FMN-containing dehydrogenase
MGGADSLASLLAEIVGDRNVWGRERLKELDPGYHPENYGADLMVLPASTDEVSRIAELCTEHRVAIVPHGGLSGLAGGAASSRGQIIIGLSRMARLEQLDPLGGIAVVEAGVRLQTVEEAAREHGLTVGIDLGARGTATIGGMISTNAGGMEAFRNGSMRNRIVGLEAVLPSGEVLDSLSLVTKCNAGYDLKQLFCGAEGTLGIVTRAVLKLSPAMPAPVTFLVACNSASDGLRLVHASRVSQDLDLVHAEIMWRGAARTVAEVLGLEQAISFCDAPVYVIIEVATRGSQIIAEDAFFEALEAAGATESMLDALFAKSGREREQIWLLRESSFAVDDKLDHCMWFDVSVPLSRIDSYMSDLDTRLQGIDPELGLYAIGHLADGNLHFTIGSGNELSPARQQDITAAVNHGLKEMGGSFSAEHGIGLEKKSTLAKAAGAVRMRLFRAIKQAFDPLGIMNPGKVIDH